MGLNAGKVQSFVGRCLYYFLMNGTMKAYGVILERTVSSFNTSHAIVGFIFTFQTSVAFMTAPAVKLLEGRLSPRIVAILGGLLATGGFVFQAIFPPTSPWLLLLALSVTGLGFGMVNFVTLVCLKDSFGREYPTVYSVTVFSLYVGICTLPPLMEYLSRNFGESVGMLAFGALSSMLIVNGIFTGPCCASPSDVESGMPPTETDKDAKAGREVDDLVAKERGSCKDTSSRLALIVEHREFVYLFVTLGISYCSYIAWSLYLVPYGESIGMDSSTAVWLSTLGGIGGILGKVIGLGVLRVGLAPPTSVIVAATLMAVSYCTTLFLGEFLVFAAMAAMSGCCLSVWGTLCSAWVPETVCDYHFKGAVATTHFVSGALAMMGGLLTGAVFDVSGSYRYAFAMLAVLGLAGTVVSSLWYWFILTRPAQKS